MKTYFFKSALCQTDDGRPEWKSDVLVQIANGTIVEVVPNSVSSGNVSTVSGVAIPAMVNVHSHAFQRGFAGLSEYRTAANDSFWTWRKLMYAFVDRLTPDDVYVIAKQLYLEMILAGYSWVGEFHYLHNDPAGKMYPNESEMADAVIRAANDTGIGICLLPVLYQRSGFSANGAGDGQKRFVLANDDFCQLLSSCNSKLKTDANANLGLAFHSLRAVSPESIESVLNFRSEHLVDCPVHIHVAEQTQEVDDCLAATGRRSVEFLLSEFKIDEAWCLIHATHMNDLETTKLASTGATVGLCPTTESNLGDGFFPAQDFLDNTGSISIGSDSHCSINVSDELRTLEYGQRLKTRQRAVLGSDEQSVGRRLYEACATGGAKAIGVKTGTIAAGYKADLVIIDDQHATIAGSQQDRLLDRLVFTNTGCPISRRMINGCWIENEAIRAALQDSSLAFLQLNQRLGV